MATSRSIREKQGAYEFGDRDSKRDYRNNPQLKEDYHVKIKIVYHIDVRCDARGIQPRLCGYCLNPDSHHAPRAEQRR